MHLSAKRLLSFEDCFFELIMNLSGGVQVICFMLRPVGVIKLYSESQGKMDDSMIVVNTIRCGHWQEKRCSFCLREQTNISLVREVLLASAERELCNACSLSQGYSSLPE